MTDITPERLARIKARGSEIPEGPWKSIPWHIAEGPSEVRVSEGWLLCSVSSDDIAAFIAAARQDIPDLVAALEAAQAENAKQRADMAKIYELALEAAKEISGIKAELGRRIKP